MIKQSFIPYNESLIIRMIVEICRKVPGVDNNKPFNVLISPKHDEIGVFFTPINFVTNIYDVASKLQSTIYFNLKRTFDLYSLIVNMIVLGDE